MLVKEKGVSGAPGIFVQANISWNKTHHEFEADGRLSPPNCEKTSGQLGLAVVILNITLLLNRRGAHLGQEIALNLENDPHFRLSRAAADRVSARPPLVMVPFTTPSPITRRSVLLLGAA